MSLTSQLVSLIRRKPVTREDLDRSALLALDALACAYAGSATPVGAVLRRWAGGGDLDRKRAAFLMGAMTHITETDDLHRASVTHPGCVVVPAVLAQGAALDASPERQLTAMLHGFEAMCRIGAAVGPAHYRVWHNTATCGPFGSAMAAATLLGLDDAAAVDALGNAGTQASGLWQFIETGAMSKHLHAGRACESGLLAAELAQAGFTGPPEILEGGKGFFVGLCPDPEPERILADADAPWQLLQTSIKPWPSCRHTHPLIDCALELHALLDGGQVESVRVATYRAALDVCDRATPQSQYEAKFSLQHCAAIALIDGEVALDSFDGASRARVADLAARVEVVAEEPFTSRYPVSWGAELSVKTVAGAAFKVLRRNCRGDPELALDADEMRAKALGLLDYGGLDPAAAARLCDAVLALPDASEAPDLHADFVAQTLE